MHRLVEKMVENQGVRIEPYPDLPLADLNNLYIPQFLINLKIALKEINGKLGTMSTDSKNN